MKFRLSAGALWIAAMAAPLVLSTNCFALRSALTGDQLASLSLPAAPTDLVSSSRADLPEAARTTAASASAAGSTTVRRVATKPFTAFAIGVTAGAAGIGVQMASPLAGRMNLRESASFLNTSPVITADGINLNTSIALKSVNTSIDIFPFGGSFRISPGVTVYNGNHLHASASVPGGQTFELNDVDYTSSTANPISGTFDMAFGRQVAPSLTVGFGNMIPHKRGQHWSVPFEVGFEYIGTPVIALSLSGSACQQGVCMPVATDPQTQANVAAEQTSLNNDISALRFFPIASIGLSYKFGGNGEK